MKISYDLIHLPERKYQRQDSEEIVALKVFLAGPQRNMVIEYEEPKKAKRRYDALRGYRKNHKLEDVFDCYRVDHQIVITKTKKKGRPASAK